MTEDQAAQLVEASEKVIAYCGFFAGMCVIALLVAAVVAFYVGFSIGRGNARG